MAQNDTSMKAEIRAMTDYDLGIMDNDSLQALLDLTKREIQSSKEKATFDFYDDLRAERTLFWLTCIFAKIKGGEIDGGDFSISELKVKSNNSGSSFYFDNFWRHYHSIGEGRPRGHLKGQRSNREYNYDNSATDPE